MNTICLYCRHAFVAAEAATLIFAIIWKNTANKAKVAAKGTTAALVKRIIRHQNDKDGESIKCIERLCIALASMLLYKSNHEKLIGNIYVVFIYFPPFFYCFSGCYFYRYVFLK